MAISIRAAKVKDRNTVEDSGGAFTHGQEVTASNVGWAAAGATLTTYSGPSTITTDGTTIDSKDISGGLQINADNVTIRKSRIRAHGSSPTDGGVMAIQQGTFYDSQTNLTIEDCEITRPSGSSNSLDYALQLYGTGVTITRCKIWNVTSGIHFNPHGGSCTVEDTYIGQLVDISGLDHNDCVIANGGANNITINRCRLEVPIAQTTPIAAYPEGPPNTYWLVDSCWIDGGGYGCYVGYTVGSESPNNHFTVQNNIFGRSFFANCGSNGPVNTGSGGFLAGTGNVWTNNTWGGGAAATGAHTTGSAITVT